MEVNEDEVIICPSCGEELYLIDTVCICDLCAAINGNCKCTECQMLNCEFKQNNECKLEESSMTNYMKLREIQFYCEGIVKNSKNPDRVAVANNILNFITEEKDENVDR